MVNPWLTLKKDNNNNFIAECDKMTIEQVLNSYRYEKLEDKYKLHLEILPCPIIGNYIKSKVLILQLNPGYAENDLKERDENKFPQRIEDLNNSLKQNDNANFYALNDNWQNTGMYTWWRKHLSNNIKKEQRDLFCVLEYFPYPSEKYHGYFDNIKLESQNYIFDIVRDAIKNDKFIIITRSASKWYESVFELKNYKKLFLTSSTQNASITDNNLISAQTKSKNNWLTKICATI